MQTPRQSAIETAVRVAFNFLTGLLIQVTFFPAIFHARTPLSVNMGIGLLFMGNSFAGGYLIRRIFNALRSQ